jgi:hypothetical protein
LVRFGNLRDHAAIGGIDVSKFALPANKLTADKVKDGLDFLRHCDPAAS